MIRSYHAKARSHRSGKRLPAVGVTDAAGRLVGLITPENVGEMMMVMAALPPKRGTLDPKVRPSTSP